MRLFLAFLLLIFIQPAVQGQSKVWDLTFEFEAYPTGLIPGVQLAKGFADHHMAHIRLGYNWVRHRDLGVHGDERGDGYGFTLGYAYYLKPGFRAWHLGIKNDIWFNTISWEDYDKEGGILQQGESKIIVVQPSFEAGYTLGLGDRWTISPHLGLGVEINVKTDGEDVGQGVILRMGFKVGPRF